MPPPKSIQKAWGRAVAAGALPLDEAALDKLVARFTDNALNTRLVAQVFLFDEWGEYSIFTGKLKRFFKLTPLRELGALDANIVNPDESEPDLSFGDGSVTVEAVPMVYRPVDRHRLESWVVHELQHAWDWGQKQFRGGTGALAAVNYDLYLAHMSEARAFVREVRYLVERYGVKAARRAIDTETASSEAQMWLLDRLALESATKRGKRAGVREAVESEDAAGQRIADLLNRAFAKMEAHHFLRAVPITRMSRLAASLNQIGRLLEAITPHDAALLIRHHVEDAREGLKDKAYDYVERSLADLDEVADKLGGAVADELEAE